MYQSFCGIPAWNGKAVYTGKKNELPPIDIIYPTLDTVQSSRLGPPVGYIARNQAVEIANRNVRVQEQFALTQVLGTNQHFPKK